MTKISSKIICICLFLSTIGLYFYTSGNKDAVFGYEYIPDLKSFKNIKEAKIRSQITYFDINYQKLDDHHEGIRTQIIGRQNSPYNYELFYISPLYYQLFSKIPILHIYTKLILTCLCVLSCIMMSLILVSAFESRLLLSIIFLINPFMLSAIVVEDSAIVEFFLLISTIYLLYSKVFFKNHSIIN